MTTILVGIVIFVLGFFFGMLVMALCRVSADCDDRLGLRD